MKKSKLLTLSATLLMALTAVGCNLTSSSTSSEPATSSEPSSVVSSTSEYSVDEVLSQAATTLWTMYKDDNNSYILGNYELVKKITMMGGAYSVDVSWTIDNLVGSTEGVKLIESSDPTNFQTVYVGYYDMVVSEETSYNLVPTLTYKGTSKVMGDILSLDSKGNKKVFTRKAKQLVFNTYEEFTKIADKAGGKENSDCVAAIKGYVQGISKKGEYVYVRDEGHAYLVFGSGYDKQTDFVVGDYIAVAGPVYSFNGCYEFVKATIKKLDKTTAGYDMPTNYVDVTEDFNKAKDNKDASLAKYQSMHVEIKNCTVDSVDGSYYYFKTADGVKYNLFWSTSYFLTKDENNQWADLFKALVGEKNVKINVKGMVNCFKSAHQIYPTSVDCFEVVATDAVKAKIAAKAVSLTGYKSFFNTAAEITLPTKGVLGSTIAWSLPASAPTQFAIAEGKLKITPTKEGDVAKTTLTGVVTIGEAKANVTFDLNAKDITDAEQADLALNELQAQMTVYGGANLPTTSATYAGAEISWALKDASATGVKVTNNVLAFDVATEDKTAVLVATAKVGTVTKTKEVTVTAKPTTTIASFLTAKDKTNEVYVRGTVVATENVNTSTKFILKDATGLVYSNDKLDVKVGDEIVVKAKYTEYKGFPQIKPNTSEKVVILGNAKVDLGEADLTVTATTVVEDAAANNVIGKYDGKTVEINDGYIVKSGSYYGIAVSKDETTYKINLYSSTDLKDFVGKKVKVIGFCKGNNSKNGTINIVVASITEVTETAA